MAARGLSRANARGAVGHPWRRCPLCTDILERAFREARRLWLNCSAECATDSCNAIVRSGIAKVAPSIAWAFSPSLISCTEGLWGDAPKWSPRWSYTTRRAGNYPAVSISRANATGTVSLAVNHCVCEYDARRANKTARAARLQRAPAVFQYMSGRRIETGATHETMRLSCWERVSAGDQRT